jgi:hypothetical protein
MSNFIFNAAAAALTAATLDLSTGNYYAHLVTTTPQLTDSTVANLVLPTISGYVPTVLTGLNDNGQRWTFDNFTFPRYVFAATPPVGVVICKRLGASPAASDQVICYSDFLNSIGQVILTPVGAYLIGLSFGANGAISRALRYQYSSGSYAVGNTVPHGLFYLLGTENNTRGFSNPAPSKVLVKTNYGDGDAVIDGTLFGTNYVAPDYAFDFGSKTAKVGTLGYFCNTGSLGAVNIYGSNILPSWTVTEIINNLNWTLLAANSSPTIDTNNWGFTTSSNSSYWRYLKFSFQAGGVGELELYNSSILSPTQNLT